MTTNCLLIFFEKNNITTVYDKNPQWGMTLREALTSLPEYFFRNISQEDKIKNMQELTKIRDSMTPEALSTLHSEHFSNACSSFMRVQASMDFEAAKIIILSKACNPELVVRTNAIGYLLQGVCPNYYQNVEARHYINTNGGLLNLHKFYDCLLEDIYNQEKFENKNKKEQNDNDVEKICVRQVTLFGKNYLKSANNVLYDPKTKEEVGTYDQKMNIICEIVDEDEDEDEYSDCKAGPDPYSDFVFPAFQDDEFM